MIIGQIDFTHTNKGRRLPTVFTHDEAMRFIFDGHVAFISWQPTSCMALAYVLWKVRLRVMDIDFAQECIFVREAKGEKWRRTLLPKSLLGSLKAQLDLALALHQQDLSEGFGEVYLPYALAKKYQRRHVAPHGNMYFLPPIARKILAVMSFADIILANSRFDDQWQKH